MIVAILLLLIVVSIPAWCRRRNVGIMTWAMIPLLAILDLLTGCRLIGFTWMMGLALFSLIRESLLLAGAVLLLLLVICGMIVFWPGWRLKMPGIRVRCQAITGTIACSAYYSLP